MGLVITTGVLRQLALSPFSENNAGLFLVREEDEQCLLG